MAFSSGPIYSEWLEAISHHAHHSFDDLKAMVRRIEEDKSLRLTRAQCTDLLERLGDLQIDAANHAFHYDSKLAA